MLWLVIRNGIHRMNKSTALCGARGYRMEWHWTTTRMASAVVVMVAKGSWRPTTTITTTIATQADDLEHVEESFTYRYIRWLRPEPLSEGGCV